MRLPQAHQNVGVGADRAGVGPRRSPQGSAGSRSGVLVWILRSRCQMRLNYVKGIGAHARQAGRPWDPHEGEGEGKKRGDSCVLDVCAGLWGPQATPPSGGPGQGCTSILHSPLTQAGPGWAQQQLRGPPPWQSPILEV